MGNKQCMPNTTFIPPKEIEKYEKDNPEGEVEYLEGMHFLSTVLFTSWMAKLLSIILLFTYGRKLQGVVLHSIACRKHFWSRYKIV